MQQESFSGLRFLIVDDVLDTRRVLRRILSALSVAPADIVERGTVDEAITWLHSDGESCDVVISDFHLAGGKGLDILQFVRNSRRIKHMPFLMITNDLMMDDLVKAKSLGVSAYLLKPLSVANVHEHVVTAIKKESNRR